jgi:ribose transport system ATP-binding protein
MLRGLASKVGLIDRGRERAAAEEWRRKAAIRAESTDAPILSLSGGNQQKVLVARAFASGADVVLFDDPMRGIDVGTNRELAAQVRAAAGEGRCFLWYTTENAELVDCDRVYVFYEGRITDEIPAAEYSEERVLHASFADLEAA